MYGGIQMPIILGIDGGGTKTVAVLSNERGEILAKVIGGSSNPTAISKQQFESELFNILSKLKSQNEKDFEKVECCFAGLSGVKELSFEKNAKSVIQQFYDEAVSIIIENDACIALFSGTLGMPGIVQIAGTGAITYCLDSHSNSFRSGGWGYLFDDEGSGYDLGREALKAVVKSYDFRGEETVLSEKILKHFQINDLTQIVDCIYNEQNPRALIAPLSRYVVQAAMEGDNIANHLLVQAAGQYIQAIEACATQARWNESEEIPTVLVGGVFSNFNLFYDVLLTQPMKYRLQFLQPQIEPVGGAIIGGLKHLNEEVTTEFLRNFAKK